MARRKMPDAGGQPPVLKIELAYALPDQQVVIALEVEEGTTVREAIAQSGLLERFPGVRAAPGRVGVFGRVVDPDAPVRDGDRVEIYRPLIADPRDARRERAKASGKRNRA